MWQHIVTSRLINQHRNGWPGVWDALKSAVTGNERLSVPQTLTVEMHVCLKEGPAVDAVLMLPGETTDNGQANTRTHINGTAISDIALGR
jgi:hypothetical protein